MNAGNFPSNAKCNENEYYLFKVVKNQYVKKLHSPYKPLTDISMLDAVHDRIKVFGC